MSHKVRLCIIFMSILWTSQVLILWLFGLMEVRGVHHFWACFKNMDLGLLMMENLILKQTHTLGTEEPICSTSSHLLELDTVLPVKGNLRMILLIMSKMI
jgi:hypothetical protein